MEPPTERQLAFAKDLGVSVPPGATKSEVSALISAKLGQGKSKKENPANERHLAFARKYGLEFTSPIDKKLLFDKILITLSKPGREKDILCWFTFRIYREIIQRRHAHTDIIPGPEHPLIQKIADELLTDNAVIKSIKRYRGRELIWFGEWTAPNGWVQQGGSQNTVAYKRTASLLRQGLNLP